MIKPFNIFPSTGYKNSQFQIISLFDDLNIEIYDQKDVIIHSVKAHTKNPTIIQRINSTGKLVAKCTINNTLFQQEIEVKEAIRLGSSEFKKSYVFDNTDYSFFLMKDRLLLYDEKRDLILIENHYSPSIISEINNSNYLFITKIGSSDTGVINLGVYNTETFSLVGELLNKYREIKILSESNIAWLYNIKSNTIDCFELTNQSQKYLTEIKTFDNYLNYYLDNLNNFIYINFLEHVKISNLINLHNCFEIEKKENNAIDKFGNVFTLENGILEYTNLISSSSVWAQIDFAIKIEDEEFIHIGKNIIHDSVFSDLNLKTEEIKEDLIRTISHDNFPIVHQFLQEQVTCEEYYTHKIYAIRDGFYILQKRMQRDFTGVILTKGYSTWNAKPVVENKVETTLLYVNSQQTCILIDKTQNLTVYEYLNDMLIVRHESSIIVFSGKDRVAINNEDTIEVFKISDKSYLLVESKEGSSLFLSTNLHKPLLDKVEILNRGLLEKHQILWYGGFNQYVLRTNKLNAFDMINCINIIIDEQLLQHTMLGENSRFQFFENYALTSNGIVLNPATLEIKDALIGFVDYYSKQLNKIVTHRNNLIYLSKYNRGRGKYEVFKISLEESNYTESYLSPNGQFLVLQDESNRYSLYDIQNSKSINFISGKFLAFRNDGNLIIEQDGTRAVKIIDPNTFQDITPPNYHHYRFMSPDGKLYAQVSSKVKYVHILSGREINGDEVANIRQELDEPSINMSMDQREVALIKIAENRKALYDQFKNIFDEMGIDNCNSIRSQTVVKLKKFTEIGITGSDIVTEVYFPDDLAYYNYSSFSYDNKYFGYVGKPLMKGLIHLCKIDFDEEQSKLSVSDSYISRYPRFASWVCGFSKTGYFATYDSTPDTYIIFVDDGLFERRITETEFGHDILEYEDSIYKSYNKWNLIRGKNFLCFSPTGKYLALSEQGYEPLTLGGYGHQESSAVHIARTRNGQIVDSFTGHGDKIKDDKYKKVIFVAFSEDESKIMTLSSDGVVIIRDINISDKEQYEKMPSAEERLANITFELVN